MTTPDPSHRKYQQALAAVLTDQCEFLGWTLFDLARESGICNQSVKKIMGGSVSPMSYTVRRLATALHLEHWELLRMVREYEEVGVQ